MKTRLLIDLCPLNQRASCCWNCFSHPAFYRVVFVIQHIPNSKNLSSLDKLCLKERYFFILKTPFCNLVKGRDFDARWTLGTVSGFSAKSALCYVSTSLLGALSRSLEACWAESASVQGTLEQRKGTLFHFPSCIFNSLVNSTLIKVWKM